MTGKVLFILKYNGNGSTAQAAIFIRFNAAGIAAFLYTNLSLPLRMDTIVPGTLLISDPFLKGIFGTVVLYANTAEGGWGSY